MSPCTIVVTAASIHPDAVALLAGHRLVYADVRATEAELEALCRAEQPDALMVRYGQVSARVMAASTRLRVVAKHGVGTDNIDRAAAQARGIPVEIALGSNSQATAEHALGLMLACARRIPALDARMRQGHWDRDSYAGLELSGATLGVVGAGAIGRRVLAMGHALGMRLRVSTPRATPDALPDGCEQVDIDTLVNSCDVISLHCPLTADTRGLLSRAHRPPQTRCGGHQHRACRPVRRRGDARSGACRARLGGPGLFCR